MQKCFSKKITAILNSFHNFTYIVGKYNLFHTDPYSIIVSCKISQLAQKRNQNKVFVQRFRISMPIFIKIGVIIFNIFYILYFVFLYNTYICTKIIYIISRDESNLLQRIQMLFSLFFKNDDLCEEKNDSICK